jgi:hypothetical protein
MVVQIPTFTCTRQYVLSFFLCVLSYIMTLSASDDSVRSETVDDCDSLYCSLTKVCFKVLNILALHSVLIFDWLW